ncbi:hypothetical protein [Streptomyces sp. NPDC046821]|uniref:hypothetical protein n=1 Tax=Streptomyces sp. NPDC046821 TaxID=3154702 RepID=UPI0033EAE6A1
MVRNVLGSFLALVGAAAVVYSPFRAWYDGRHGRSYRLGDLFSGAGVTDARAQLFGSVFLPFLVAAAIALAGVVLRSRPAVACAGVLALGFTVLWMVRVGQFEGRMVVSGDGSGLGLGVALAFGGGVLMLIGAAVMSGRRRPAPRLPEYVDHGPPPTADHGPPPTMEAGPPTLEGPLQPYADQPPYPEPPYPYGEPLPPYGEPQHPHGEPPDEQPPPRPR